ncbi:MAG: tyrosine-type recombinase/integrase [Lachnospiraceae bacterium]|nr:tyrosine-type recombinase/integrase [Lachnospiraceae bacterium]
MTVALTREQYKELINALFNGTNVTQPNEPVATMLQIEANTGIRISDVLKLRRGDIVKDGNRYRFDIKERKTKKPRTFTVPDPVYMMVEKYCIDHKVEKGEKIFPYDEDSGARGIQKILKKLSDYYGYDNIGTHSFRKYFATKAYINSGYDIELVSRLMQHANSSITRRYIGIQDEKTENVLRDSVDLI